MFTGYKYRGIYGGIFLALRDVQSTCLTPGTISSILCETTYSGNSVWAIYIDLRFLIICISYKNRCCLFCDGLIASRYHERGEGTNCQGASKYGVHPSIPSCPGTTWASPAQSTDPGSSALTRCCWLAWSSLSRRMRSSQLPAVLYRSTPGHSSTAVNLQCSQTTSTTTLELPNPPHCSTTLLSAPIPSKITHPTNFFLFLAPRLLPFLAFPTSLQPCRGDTIPE